MTRLPRAGYDQPRFEIDHAWLRLWVYEEAASQMRAAIAHGGMLAAFDRNPDAFKRLMDTDDNGGSETGR